MTCRRLWNYDLDRTEMCVLLLLLLLLSLLMYIRCTICAFRFPLTKPRYSGVAGRKLGTEAPPLL